MRIALGVEYIGTDYFGWQAQENLLTVQGCLEQALQKIANEPIHLFCAGRTDAGVHAEEQVVHFDTSAERSERAWVFGTNTHLPANIAVKWAKSVDETFHARFSATARCYRYIVYNHPVRSAIYATRATWYHYPLDVMRMQQAANYLLGEQDFSSFRSSQCESKTPMRNIHFINIKREGNLVITEIQANAFLHHMVRNIMGVLLKVGAKLNEPEWALEVLKAKDRKAAAETAPPDGLYLLKIIY